MPIIPDMLLSGTTVDPQDIYKASVDGGIYDPQNSPRSLEALNGLLNNQNLKGESGDPNALKIEPWMTQIGTFARGGYWGTDRWEFAYASQLAQKRVTEASNGDKYNTVRIPIANLCQEVFIPWKPSIVLFGYQAWLRQDATVWDSNDSGSNPDFEYWDLHLKIDGIRQDAHRVFLPPGRDTRSDPTDNDIAEGKTNDAGLHSENSWRWVEKSGMTTIQGPGYLKLEVEIGAHILTPDPYKCKCTIPSCAAWLLALR